MMTNSKNQLCLQLQLDSHSFKTLKEVFKNNQILHQTFEVFHK